MAHASPTNTLEFQSYTNGVGFGAQHPSINTVSSYNNDKTGSIASLASPFSIKQTIDVKLDGVGDKINYSSSTTISEAVPEPSSLVLAGIGTLGMIGYGLRRRKAVRPIKRAQQIPDRTRSAAFWTQIKTMGDRD